MCLTDIDHFGGATHVDQKANNEPILENFDLNSFLHNTDHSWDFGWDGAVSDALTAPATFPYMTGNCYSDVAGWSFDAPPKPAPSGVSALETKMNMVKDRAKGVATSYIQAIIKIHKSATGQPIEYPDTIQNQLLTMSRTIEHIHSHLESRLEKMDMETETHLDALDLDLVKCELICNQISNECPPKADREDSEWAEFLARHQKAVHKAIIPLFVYYKHTIW